MSIPKQLFFYWSTGTPISYLRYLAVASWRALHKSWPIYLYESPSVDEGLGWDFGDFQTVLTSVDYKQALIDRLGVQLKKYEPADKRILTMPPPNISDIFSYDILHTGGGWYADMDAIATKSFDYISDQGYAFAGFGNYSDWVGLFGAVPGSWVMKSILEPCITNYSPTSYNSTGTYGIIKNCTSSADWLRQFDQPDRGQKNWRCPADMFYPLSPAESAKLWSAEWEHSKASTWSVHLYGGNGDYAIKNKLITPDYVLDHRNQEWICRYVRTLPTAYTLLDGPGLAWAREQQTIVDETKAKLEAERAVKRAALAEARAKRLAALKEEKNDRDNPADVRPESDAPAQVSVQPDGDVPRPESDKANRGGKRKGPRDNSPAQGAALGPDSPGGPAEPTPGKTDEPGVGEPVLGPGF
jgi:hypothetical protein